MLCNNCGSTVQILIEGKKIGKCPSCKQVVNCEDDLTKMNFQQMSAMDDKPLLPLIGKIALGLVLLVIIIRLIPFLLSVLF